MSNQFVRNFGQGSKTKASERIAPDASWKNVTRGGIIPHAGNAESYETGDWRSRRPVWIPDKCVHCLICWRYCPDSAIIPEDGKFKEFDYHHCKGCGVCVNVCPTQAIDFVDEDTAKDDETQAKEKI
jgi:pyruvate ferredoxin oxidoreductase delta subunit